MNRACKRCGDPIPAGKRPTAVYCSDNCRKRMCDETTLRATCGDCGAPLGAKSRGKAERCVPCERAQRAGRADETFQLIARLWAEGKSYREIAHALGVGPNSDIGDYLARARGAGYDLPHRYPESRRRKSSEARWGVAA